MYDTIIIGAGPAGMTAGIYLARGGYKVLILEKETIGGQIASSPLVENYPGYAAISGAELSGNMFDQVINLGVVVEIETVTKIKDGKKKTVIADGHTYEAKTIIVATGAKYRTLGIESEEKFLGNSIHFCVSCDGAFYKDKKVAVIGGGNSAITNALYLADIAKEVYVIQNMEKLSCEQQLEENIHSKKNVQIHLNSRLMDFLGDESLEGIRIKKADKEIDIKVDGVFEAIGHEAQTEVSKSLLEMDVNNYIIGDEGKTNLSGIFVAGDCRSKEIRQLTTAVADGTTAAIAAINYLKNA
jgi:thioredoxin reductase (NADPH)